MANEIDTALVTQFSDMVHVRAQQMKSRLRQHFAIRKMTGDVWAYDGIGIVDATEQYTVNFDHIFPQKYTPNMVYHFKKILPFFQFTCGNTGEGRTVSFSRF